MLPGAPGAAPSRLFLQNVIAVIWDFDKTLIAGYMQEPLFKRFGVDPKTFWDEVNTLPEVQRRYGLHNVSTDSIYLNHILTYAQAGRFAGLNNALLRELGAEIELYAGLPEFFPELKQHVAGNPAFRRHAIELEHYIVSTGLYEMIMGSKIAPYVDDVWGCEFIELVPPPGYLSGARTGFADEPAPPRVISQLGYVIDNTSKTRAIFEINKGSNKMPNIGVNDAIPPQERRIPFQNMIYIADGPSDVPVFSILNQYGGHTYAVYKPGDAREFEQVDSLNRQHRVQAFGPADYTRGSQTPMWITQAVDRIAKRIVDTRERALTEQLGQAPRHLG
jgi:hypothetical protein